MKTRRAKSTVDTVLTLCVIAGLAYFMFPGIFDGILSTGDGAISGQIVVDYSDGSQKTYEATNERISLAVAEADSSNPISKITFITRAKPTWEDKTVSSISGVSWNVLGAVKVDGETKQSFGTPSSLPTTISDGSLITISSTSISGSTLDTWIPMDYKEHTLSFEVSVVCMFKPPGYDTYKEISGSPRATIRLENIGFPALLTVTIDAITLS